MGQGRITSFFFLKKNLFFFSNLFIVCQGKVYYQCVITYDKIFINKRENILDILLDTFFKLISDNLDKKLKEKKRII